jgi:hypothetical protein
MPRFPIAFSLLLLSACDNGLPALGGPCLATDCELRYLTKPIQVNELEDAIGTILGND